MADTRLADVVVPEVFLPYILERSINLNRFYQSGVMTPLASIEEALKGGSYTFDIPFWKDLTGSTAVPSETVADSVVAITSDKAIVRRQIRHKVWGANSLSAALSGDDPMQAIGNRVANFWAKAFEDLTIYSCRGVFDAVVEDNSSDAVKDISIALGQNATSDNLISSESTIDAVLTQGDHWDELVGIAMHSAVYATLLKNDLIDFIPDSQGKLNIPVYMGLKVIVSDNMYRVSAGTGYKYHSYLFKAGAIGFGSYGGPIKEVEMYRDPYYGSGLDILFTRRQFAIAPLGYSWTMASDTGITPTDANLYDDDSWTRVFNLKNTGIVCLISNG